MDWKNMELSDLNDLDFNDLGGLPTPIKAIICVLITVVVCYGYYTFFTSEQIERYEQSARQELTLRTQFKQKYNVAINADAYKEQLAKMEEDFAQLLQRHPKEHETPELLEDISYVGTSSGLSFNKLQFEKDIEREFYTEKPLRLEVVGGYHEFGEFLSRVAGLARIVTLHDFDINVLKGDVLELKLLARTYRYKSAEQRQKERLAREKLKKGGKK